MQKLVAIYSLEDPRDGCVRYVGKTKNSIRQRLGSHCYLAGKRKTYISNWVLSLIRIGLRPTIKVLESVPENEWRVAEIFWIRYLRFAGCSLVNHSEGGQGPNGTKRPELAAISKLRFSGKPLSEAHKLAISIGLKGTVRSKEAIEATAKAQRGRKRSNETRKLMSDSRIEKGTSEKQIEAIKKLHEKTRGTKRSDETRMKISEALKGKKKSESHKAALSRSKKLANSMQ